MASRWENSFVLLTLSLEVQRPGCEPSPWLSRVGAASGLSGRLAHAQPACGCPDTWPLVDLAGQGPLRLNSRPKRYYLLRPSPGTLEDCLSSQGHVLLTIYSHLLCCFHTDHNTRSRRSPPQRLHGRWLTWWGCTTTARPLVGLVMSGRVADLANF